MLRAQLPAGCLVGDGETPEGVPEVPDRDLTHPYFILYPIRGGGFDGPPLAAPEADATFMYELATMHRGKGPCQDGADRARWIITSRLASGAFRFPLAAHLTQPAHYTAAGLALGIMDRSTAGPPGAPERGSTLWRADDLFAVTVTTHPA